MAKRPRVDRNLARLLGAHSPGWLTRRLGVSIETLQRWGRGAPSERGARALAELAAEERARTRRPKPAKRPAATKKKRPAKPPTKTPRRAPQKAKVPSRKAVAHRQPNFENLVELLGAEALAKQPWFRRRVKKSPESIRRWRERGVPIEVYEEVELGARAALRTTQRYIRRWIANQGVRKAAGTFGVTPSTVTDWQKNSIPPEMVPVLWRRVRLERSGKLATPEQLRRAGATARKRARHLPPAPPPPRRPAPRPLPPRLPQLPPRRPPPPPREISIAEWEQARQGTMQAYAEAVAETVRGERSHRTLIISGRSRAVRSLVLPATGERAAVEAINIVQGWMIQSFVVDLDLEKVIDGLVERARRLFKRRVKGGGSVLVKLAFGAIWDGGNPRYIKLHQHVGIATTGERYNTFEANTQPIVHVAARALAAGMRELEERLRDLLIDDDASIAAIAEQLPLLILEGAEIIVRPSDQPKHLRDSKYLD